MKQLQSNFIGKGEVKGYKFSLLGMTDRAFIYEVNSGGSKHYEVFKKRLNHLFGCISYPTSKAFGIWAWTYNDLRAAIRKYNYLSGF
ncbi:hypothetical protein [Lutimonas zeaxanthinifaciens]|uniref:hypothetical protein n=1 Tax=Lutimonas zeaxanthinifaciens TaxID=3060215 RepID=UPI00265CE8E2|nr:hypothetical protein [Lutimonas sp. YSD2104]WKK66511.1 hypothetical protein QZH61_02555 [Lutimonas sp. YSD2104]